MHIYAFGSVCRGEIVAGSDIDMLAIVEKYDSKFDPSMYSIYSYEKIKDLWLKGNPFAWHLSLESQLIYTSDNLDYLRSLGGPREYNQCINDCYKFYDLFKGARESLKENGKSRVFELSTIFLSIRNIATCFSLGVKEAPNFSRDSALHLGEDSLRIPYDSYDVFMRARILSTRGYGNNISDQDYLVAMSSLEKINHWMQSILKQVKHYE